MNGLHPARRRSCPCLATLVAVACMSLAPAAAAQDPGAGDPPKISVVPEIAGTPAIGATLTATSGDWRPRNATAAYQWLRCPAADPCVEIPGATARSYTVAAGDAGHSLAIRLVVTSSGGASSVVESERTAVVPVPPQPPASDAAPAISGDAVEGALLTGTSGTWSGTAPLSFTRRWLRCDEHGAACEALPGAGFDSFRVAADDAGHTLRFAVTAANVAGETTATSPPTAVVVASPSPSPSPAPTPTPTSASTSVNVAAPPAISAPAVAPIPVPRMAPWPVVRIAGRFKDRTTTFTVVSVRAPRAAVITVTCRGTGCPYRRRAVAARIVRFRALQRTFLAGSVIEVRVTAPGVIGAYTRIKTRRGRSPARLDQCLAPGAAGPTPCPPA